jgi:hypothetical protein
VTNPGLCGVCVNVRIVESGKGSRFYLCKLSAVDPRFPKYPRLPVLQCIGFEKKKGSGEEVSDR